VAASVGGSMGGSTWGGRKRGGSGSGSTGMDAVDSQQQVDIERLIGSCHQLQDR
jgi:hypothetical protein